MKLIAFFKLIIFLVISAIFMCSIAFLFGCFNMPPKTKPTVGELASPKYTTVIIDAGHGGEDGGTSSASGLVEKDVNLDISNMLRDMLKANGINVIMTRENDKLLYDRNVDYHGRKKKLDLAARLSVANSTPNTIFVSIHMNSFTDPKYSGMQVWYSPNNKDSYTLAEVIRAQNNAMLQSNNKRQTTRATSAINILYNAKCPAVLVECGFLSNPNEARLFESDEYRQRVAFVICCAISDFLNNANKE